MRLLLALTLCAFSYARERQSYGGLFEVTLKDGTQVDAYVTRPVGLSHPLTPPRYDQPRAFGRWSVPESLEVGRRVVAKAARYIDQYNRSKGYVNRVNAWCHRNEMRNLRDHRWPLVVFTPRGRSEKILLTLSVAFSWNGEPLPFEDRFGGWGVGVDRLQPFPDRQYLPDPQARENFTPALFYDEEQKRFVSDELSDWIARLPWIVGARAEFKHLLLAEGAPEELLEAAHTLVVALSLHRFSPQPTSDLTRSLQGWALFTTEALRERLRSIPANALRSESYLNYLGGIASRYEGFQTNVAASRLFAQVSEPAWEGKDGPLQRYYRKRWALKTVAHDILETKRFGTEGIRTRIYELDALHFDQATGLAVNKGAGMLADGILFEAAQKLRWGKSLCAALLAGE